VVTNPITGSGRGSFLLELLYFAGWQLQVRHGQPTRIRATRGDVELDVTGPDLPDAAGTVFARAMRSSRDDDGSGGSVTSFAKRHSSRSQRSTSTSSNG
jgi:hypothetical protein